MPKCKKVKRPCKICLRSVTKKTGLQCQGACKCWIHYICANYTPGKIKDIKAGLIKITCPCPDCNSISPKEQRTDDTSPCTNSECPANHPPICKHVKCPGNVEQNKMNTIAKCGKECKRHSNPCIPDSPGLQPIRPKTPEPSPMSTQKYSPGSEHSTSKSTSSCSTDESGDREYSMEGVPSLGALEQMCNTVGQLTNQINSLMNKMKQAVQESSGCGGNGKCCSHKGPKSMCPKPCYCPGNPTKKN